MRSTQCAQTEVYGFILCQWSSQQIEKSFQEARYTSLHAEMVIHDDNEAVESRKIQF